MSYLLIYIYIGGTKFFLKLYNINRYTDNPSSGDMYMLRMTKETKWSLATFVSRARAPITHARYVSVIRGAYYCYGINNKYNVKTTADRENVEDKLNLACIGCTMNRDMS